MQINFKQSQFELFPGSPGSSSDAGRPRYLFAHLTLSLETVVIGGIIGTMLMVFAFSLGVERGKVLAFNKTSKTELVQATPTGTKKQIEKLAQPVKKSTTKNIQSAKNLTEISSAIDSQDKKIVVASLPNPSEVSALENKHDLEALSNEVKDIVQKILDNPYTVQVASYKGGNKYAQKEVSVLQNKGFEAFVMDKGNYSIVCVGKFPKKDEAQKTLALLKRTYNDCLLRRL